MGDVFDLLEVTRRKVDALPGQTVASSAASSEDAAIRFDDESMGRGSCYGWVMWHVIGKNDRRNVPARL